MGLLSLGFGLRRRGLPGVVSGEQQPVDSVPPPHLGRLVRVRLRVRLRLRLRLRLRVRLRAAWAKKVAVRLAGQKRRA